ncbi:MAG: WD40 repeat domain-containing protein [Pirellulales bacterium]
MLRIHLAHQPLLALLAILSCVASCPAQQPTAAPARLAGPMEAPQFEHRGVVQDIAFSPDGRTLATCADDPDDPNDNRTVYLWEAATGKLLRRLQANPPRRNPSQDGSTTAVAFSPDGKLIAGCWGKGGLTIWDTASGDVRSSFQTGGSVKRCLRFSPDGAHIVAGNWIGEIVALRWADRVLAGRWQIPAEEPAVPQIGADDLVRPDSVTSLDISPDGARIVASRWKSASTEAIVWKFDSPDPVVRIEQPNEVAGRNRRVFHTVRFSRDGSQLISAGVPFHLKDIAQGGRRSLDVHVREIRHWDAATGKLLAEYNDGLRPDEFQIVLQPAMANSLNDVAPVHNSGVLDVSPDGQTIATFADGIQLWRKGRDAPFRSISDGGRVFRFSPDGKRIATSIGNVVKIFEIADGDRMNQK